MEHLARKLINWASILEPGTREQALRTASMPFIWPHLALMPDAHQGKGATVGSVIPTLGAIMPAAVGVDIGCGMIAVRTGLVTRRPGRRSRWPGCARRSRRRCRCRPGSTTRPSTTAGPASGSPSLRTATARTAPRRSRRTGGCSSARSGRATTSSRSAWTSGTGFWLFLHSGSRGVGNKLATRHIKVARAWCERAWIQLPDPDLAYLVEGTNEFLAYLRDLRWAQHFALLNREEMMARVAECLADFMGRDVPAAETIQCHHNYTEQMSGDLVRHWKSRPAGRSGHVWLSRKGAIDASAGKPGLIPGSMGTALLRRDRPGQQAVAELLAARRGPRVQPVRRTPDVHPGAARRRDAGNRVAAHGRVPRRDPRRVQRHRHRDGRRRRPGGDPAHAAADRQRQGRMRDRPGRLLGSGPGSRPGGK